MNSQYNSAPYPSEVPWDPVQSLEELNRITINQLKPQLPERPERHGRPERPNLNTYNLSTNSINSLNDPRSTQSTPTRLKGAVPLPAKFANSSFNSSFNSYTNSPNNTQPLQQVYQSSPYPITQSASTSFINYTPQKMDNDILNSPSINRLPDIPVLTPTKYTKTNHSSSSTPSRSPIRSPPKFTNNSPSSYKSLDPLKGLSRSPVKTEYYDNRNSWRSEFNLNIDLDNDYPPQQTQLDTFDIINNNSNNNSTNSNYVRNLRVNTDFNDYNEKTLPELPELPELPSISLPVLPFSSFSLLPFHLNQCKNIEFLSEIFYWSINLVDVWSEGLLVPRIEYEKSLKLLISHKKPKLNKFIIDENVQLIIKSMERQNSIYFDDYNNVQFMENVPTSGVLTQLTNCYSYNHTKELSAGDITAEIHQCYSPRCYLSSYKQQSLLKLNQNDPQQLFHKLGEWAEFWKLTLPDLQEIESNEIKKQSHIFELIRQQQSIIRLGEIQIKVYGESFKNHSPQLLPDVKKFYNDAFNSVKPLIEIHKKYLLIPLLNKIETQGKFITGIGEIFLNWCSIATIPYLKYTEKLASVRELIKFEKSKSNSIFVDWLVSIDSNSKEVISNSLDHNRIFFSGFIGHTQLLSLALNSVLKRLSPSDLDYKLLNEAIKKVDQLNKQIDEMQEVSLQHRHLKVLSNQLTWKSNVQEIDLKLYESSRRLIRKGTVFKKREKFLTSTVCYLILLDNYLLITEKREILNNFDNYKIIEKPIPIEFLQIESKNFQIPKQEAINNNDQEGNNGESYPFKIRYSGQNISFTFSTQNLIERENWFKDFNKVKSLKSKLSLDSEVFRIDIISDKFAYEDNLQINKLPVCVKGSNLDLAINSYEDEVRNLNDLSVLSISNDNRKSLIVDVAEISRPVMYSEVLSSCNIRFQDKDYIIVGLNYGLFMCEINDNINGWKKVLELSKITQIEQLNELLIILSDQAIYSINIITLLLNFYDKNADKISPIERLSKKHVLKFKIGNHNNCKLLFLIKSPLSTINTNSNALGMDFKIKILSPIFNNFNKFLNFQKITNFSIDYKCFDIFIFNAMFVISSIKGFEIFSLNFLNNPTVLPKFIEQVKKPRTETELIKKSIYTVSSRPLGMFKVVGKKQFYLIYESFAIVIDTMGQLIGDKFILPFKFECCKIAIYENYLVCIGNDIVEIFDLNYDDVNGFKRIEPIQIINGKNIKLIDDINLKLVMTHPRISGRQLIIELVKII